MKYALSIAVACWLVTSVSAQYVASCKVTATSVRLAVEDLIETFPARYKGGGKFLARLSGIERLPDGEEKDRVLATLQCEALLANPLLDNGNILLVRRKGPRSGLTANWQGNRPLRSQKFDGSISILSLDTPTNEMETVFVPEDSSFVGDTDLHFDGNRFLFSMPGDGRAFRVYEMEIAGPNGRQSPRELPLIPDGDVDNYDACYLPDGNIIFSSTATYTGVPCVRGGSYVANLYLLNTKSGEIRRLTFDQDHNWNPTVLNNGRVMYLRWEYADLPHFAARIVFHMNPDGTNQAEYYGSGSYWPNSVFYPRAIPEHPTMFVGIVSGHHGLARAGELVIFDPAKGRFEADGAVQRIPGYGRTVEPVIRDKLADGSLPLFLHPCPLSGKYFIVAAKTAQTQPWGIYLVDVFDNMVLLKRDETHDLLEPTLIRKRPVPPVIPGSVDMRRRDATVHLMNVYEGAGLKGVPRGTVKRLRLFTYSYAYRHMGGQQDPLGVDGPWDIKCMLGTVPVEEDGSAFFRVPANLPISFQPLDAEGKALQLMRSWSTAMPGENVSCVGCHERQNMGPPVSMTLAMQRKPSDITPWEGELRGFSFRREVEPVVNEHCDRCHRVRNPGEAARTKAPQYESAYMFLRHLVRTPTMEGDMHVLEPMEYHADTTELVRMLEQGHHDVELDPGAWEKLITWIDLNTPYHGTWTENVGRNRMGDSVARRRDLMRRYAGMDGICENPGALTDESPPESMSAWGKSPPESSIGTAAGGESSVQVLVRDGVAGATMAIEMGEGMKLDFMRIPAGSLTVGERVVTIDRPFWMSRHEISNGQYRRIFPAHDSRLEPGDYLHFDNVKRGRSLNHPDQPAVKLSWNNAGAFCRRLSVRCGRSIALPTEEEWEWACRAGSRNPFWYGPEPTSFAECENLADRVFFGETDYRGPRWQWRPAVMHQNDGYRVSAPVGSFKPHPWGLCDMHGNVAEWTTSVHEPGPGELSGKRVVRGGSWSTRPKWAHAGARWCYREYQKVYDVGFRVVIRD